jgi:hypothetical protein
VQTLHHCWTEKAAVLGALTPHQLEFHLQQARVQIQLAFKWQASVMITDYSLSVAAEAGPSSAVVHRCIASLRPMGPHQLEVHLQHTHVQNQE